MQIFSPYGGISRTPIVKQNSNGQAVANVAYITMAEADGNAILLGYAPITGVTIEQFADFSITKSLNRDFLIAAFGDTPIKITLRGINFFNVNGCSLGQNKQSNDQIMTFYKKNRVSTNRFKRFDIAIATSQKNTSLFRCVITGLNTENQSESNGTSNMVYSYTMSLVGVDR